MKRAWQFSILLGASVCMGLFVYNTNFKNKSVPHQDDLGDSKYHTTMIEKPTDGSTPLDHSSLDNLAYLMWNTANEKEFSTVTRGQSTAAFTTIEIYGKRTVKDGCAITSSVSDGLVSMGEQRYFVDNKVLFRDKEKVDGYNTTWSKDEPTCYTNQKWIERMGWLPYETSGYIICEDTILEASEVTKNDDGTYSLSVKLNPEHDYAPYYYSREIKTNSNSKITPIFYNIEHTYTFNSDWQILKADVFEEYKVKTMGLEAVTKTNCTETFNYTDVQFNPSDLSYFAQYKDMEPVGGDEAEQEEVQDDVLTMLTSALQTSDGSDANFALNINMMDREIPATLALNLTDIEHVIVKMKLGNAYLEYSDQIYLDLNGMKLKIKDASLFELIEKITGSLNNGAAPSSSESLDLKQIIEDINNGKVTRSEDGKDILVESTLNLGDINATLNFHLGYENENYSLKDANASLKMNEENIVVNMLPTTSTVPSVDKEPFVSINSFDFIIEDVLDILEQKKLASNVTFTYGELEVLGEVKADFVDKLKFDLALTLNYQELSEKFNIKYLNDFFYFDYEGIKLKISSTDLQTMLNKYLGQEVKLDTNTLNVEEIIKTILNIDFDALIKDLQINEKNVNLVLALGTLQENLKDLELRFTEDTNLSIEALYDNFIVKLDVFDLTNDIVITDEGYQNLAYVDFIIDGILDIVDSKNLGGDFILSYNDFVVTGNANVDFNNALKMDVNLTLAYQELNESLNVKYLNDSIYLDYEGLKLKISIEDLERILDKYLDVNLSIDLTNINVESIIKTILGLDFNTLIKDLTLNENNMSLVLKLQELKEGLTDLQLTIKKDTNLGVEALYDSLTANVTLKEYVEIPEVDDSVYKNIAYLDFLVDDVLGIVNNKQLSSDIEFTYDTLSITGQVDVDFVDSLKLKANLNINYLDCHENVLLTYLNNNLYLEYEGIKLKISEQDLKVMLNKYLDKDVSIDLNNFKVEDVIKTILGLDFEALIKDLKLDENNISITIALEKLVESLTNLQLNIKKDASLSVEAIYDQFLVTLTLKDYEGSFDIADEEYQNLQYLEFVLDGVIGIVNDKKFNSNLTLTYENLVVEGTFKMDFASSIKVDTNLLFKINDINENINIKIIDDVIYLNYEGLSLKIALDDLQTILNKYLEKDINLDLSNVNVDTIVKTILGLDFGTLIKDLKLSEKNVVIVLALEEFVQNLLDLQLTIKQETNLNIEAIYDKFNVALEILPFEGEIVVDPSEYQDLAYIDFVLEGVLGIFDKKQFASNIELTYEGLKITGNVDVDFVDTLKAQANLTISYQDISESLAITYLDENIYLDYEGLKLKINQNDLITLINKFLAEPINLDTTSLTTEEIIKKVLSIDFNELIEELKLAENDIDITLKLSTLMNNLQDLKLRLTKDTNLSIEAIYDKLSAKLEIYDLVNEITVVDPEYQNLGYIDFIVDGVLTILDTKKIESNVNFVYQDLTILGNMKVDFVNALKVEANLTLNYKELSENLVIKMIDDVIYLNYEGLSLKVSLLDLQTILNKYLDKPVDLNNVTFNLESIIKTVLSLDFNALIKDLKLNEKNVVIVIALEELAQNLLDLQLTIKKDTNLSIEAIYDRFNINLELVDFSSDIVVDPSEYQDLAYIDFVLEGVFGILDNKKFESNVELNYLDLKVLGNAKVDFVDTLKLQANLDFIYQEINEHLVITFMNDTFYLDYEGLALMISRSELETLLTKYLNKDVSITTSNINLENIITTILGLDFNALIKDLNLNQNDINLTLGLNQLASNLLDLKLRIYKDTSLNIEAIYDKLNVKLDVNELANEIVLPNSNYQNLAYLDFILEGALGIVNNKKVAGDISFTYNDLFINGEVKVDFVSTLKLEANLVINYLAHSENIKVTYINETIYLDYEGLALKINQDDLMSLINKYSGQNITIDTNSINVESIIKTILGLDFSKLIKDLEIKESDVKVVIALKELAQNLLDLQLAIRQGTGLEIEALYDKFIVNLNLKDFVNEIVVDDAKYQNLAYIDFVLEGVLGIINNKKVQGTISLNVQDLSISGQVYVDFVNTIKLELDLLVESSRYELNERILVKYIDGFIYLDYGAHHLKLAEQDLINLIHDIDPTINTDVQSIDVNNLLKSFLELDLDKIISYLELKENELNVKLDLSSLIKDLKDVQVSIKKAVNGLDISLNLYDLMVNVNYDSSFEIVVDEITYVDLSSYVDLASSLIKLIGKESININSHEPITLLVKNNNQDINVLMNLDVNLILVNNKYEVEGTIKLELLDVKFDLNFYLDANNVLYVNVINQTLSIDLNKESLDTFVKELQNRINELQVNPIQSVNEVAETNNDKMIKDVITLINNITFKEGSLEVRLDYLLNEVTKLAIVFSKMESEDSLIFDIDLSYGNIVNGTLPLKVSKSLVKEASFLNKYKVNVTTDDVLHLVSVFVNTFKQNYFHFDISTSYTENSVMLADISGVVELRINSRPTSDGTSKLSFDLLIDLWAQEYDSKGQYLQKHHVKVTYLSKETLSANDGMLYAMYGNGQYQNNPADYLRVKSTEQGLVALYDSLMELINSEALNDVLGFILNYLEVFTNPSKVVVDLNNIVNPIIFTQDKMDISIPGSLLYPRLKDNIEVGVTTYQDLISSLDIKNLYLNYVDDNTFTRFDGLKLNLYHPMNEMDPTYEEKLQIVEPSDKERYTYDLTNLHYLIESLNNTAEQLNYEIDGNVKLSVLGIINPVVGLNAKVSRENNDLRIHVHLYVPYVLGMLSEKGIDFYYQNEYVYIHRQDTKGYQAKIKLHYTSFLDDIAYWMMKYAIGIPDNIYNQMVGQGGTSSVPFVDASKCVTNVNFTEYSYGLGLDLRIITGNDMVGILSATLNSIDVKTGALDETGNPISKKMLASITNFSVKLVKDVININSSLINVKNFTNEGVLPVDLSTYENYIKEHASMEADRYYEFSNGKWTPGRKIDHAIIFQMVYMNNIEVRYNELDKITLPTVPSIITNDDFFGKHYYKFNGFYMDEAYTTPYNLEVMPAHNVKVYAKWDEVTVNITLSETPFNKEQVFVTYEGATLEDLYTLFEPIKQGEDLYSVTGFLYEGQPYLGNTAYGDIILEPVWTKVIYKANIAGQQIDLDFASTTPLVSEGKYMILLDNNYYVIDANMITANFLYKNYIRSFNENYEIDILNFTKEIPSYTYVGINVDPKFNNKPYIGLLVREGTAITSSMLPNLTYGDYEINAWTTGDNNYYLPLNINLVVDKEIELTSYISIKKEYFTYKGTSITGFNTKFATQANGIKTLLLPLFNEVDVRIDTIAKGAFDSKNTFNTVVIPDGYKNVEALAFHNASGLKHIYVADSVSSIYQDAFMMNYNNNYYDYQPYTASIRFYHSNNASFNFDAHTITACYYVNSPRYYGEYYGKLLSFGGGDFTSCYQKFDGNICRLNLQLIANL